MTPGRRELAGARVPRGRRHAAVHGVGPRRLPRPTPTAASTSTWSARGGRCCSGTPTPRSSRRSQAAVATRHVVRHADRGRGRARRGDRRRASRRSSRCGWSPAAPRRPCRRSGWPAASPAGQDREVRRLLPRPRRRAARRGRLRRRDASACPTPRASPARSAADTIVLPYNDLAAVEEAFAEYGDEIACVITEAAAGNMGVVPPAPGFNAGPARAVPQLTVRSTSATR